MQWAIPVTQSSGNEMRRLEGQGHQDEFEASLVYVRPHINKQRINGALTELAVVLPTL